MPINNDTSYFKHHSLHIIIFCLTFVAIFSAASIINILGKTDQRITVIGKSISKVNNQIATFSLTVSQDFADKQKAVASVSELSRSILIDIIEFGIPEADVQTTNLNVYQIQDPVMEKGVQVYKPGNWYASYTINITLRDLSKSAELTDLLTYYNNTSLYGPSLQIDTANNNDISLLQEAIDNSKEKAMKMAQQSGKHLGTVITITEVPSDAFASDIMMKNSVSGMGGGGFPIQPGTSEIQKSVVVTYKLY